MLQNKPKSKTLYTETEHVQQSMCDLSDNANTEHLTLHSLTHDALNTENRTKDRKYLTNKTNQERKHWQL